MASTTTPDVAAAPRYNDYTCPHCKAGVGRPCRFRGPRRPHLLPCHAGRYAKWRRGYERWRATSIGQAHAALTLR